MRSDHLRLVHWCVITCHISPIASMRPHLFSTVLDTWHKTGLWTFSIESLGFRRVIQPRKFLRFIDIHHGASVCSYGAIEIFLLFYLLKSEWLWFSDRPDLNHPIGSAPGSWRQPFTLHKEHLICSRSKIQRDISSSHILSIPWPAESENLVSRHFVKILRQVICRCKVVEKKKMPSRW